MIRTLLFAGVVFVASSLGSVHAAKMAQWSGATMGTQYSVKVFLSDEEAQSFDLEATRLKVDKELRQVNAEMSTYIGSSEISKFNQSESTDWTDVAPDFAGVVAFAQQLAKKTGGAFDITVAPLVNAWNFGPTPRTDKKPSEADLNELADVVGFEMVEVRLDPPQLRKSNPKLQIDLSSIAKGHGVDRVCELLNSLGAENVFVEIGGEVRTSGNKEGQWWKVGIQVPDAAVNEIAVAYPLSTPEIGDAAMATSGDYRNYVELDGKRYSHTIDPRTLRPVTHSLASVSVVRDSCMEADGWATALNVLGPEEGSKLAMQEGLTTLLIIRAEDGFDRLGTGAMASYSSSVVIPPKAIANAAPNQSWAVLLITFVAFTVILFGMAVGVIFGKKAISGSCGGLANATGEDGSVSCSLCSNPADACKELRERMQQSKA